MIDVRDIESVRGARPFLVAHRAGVIAPDAPENSLRAIELAAQHGYAMSELDVSEAADGEPVLMHNELFIACGGDKDVHELPSEAISQLHYRASDQCVLTLAQGLEACASLGLAVMLDIKLRWDARAQTRTCTPAFMRRIASLVEANGLASSTVCIVDTPALREHLGSVALFQVAKDDARRVMGGEKRSLEGQFWFGWAAHLPSDGVRRLQDNGAFAIVSINTFHYPIHAYQDLARQDVERLLAAGVEGFQIDSVYEDFFEEVR